MSEQEVAADSETAEPTSSAPPLSVEERIAFLEAQNEGMKRVGGLALVLILILGGIVVHNAYTDLQTVSTRGLVLMNDDNQLTAAWSADRQGRVMLLRGNYGMLTPHEPLPDDFQGVAFYDSSGRPRLLVGEDRERRTVFTVLDPERKVAFNPFEGMPSPPRPQAEPKASPTPAKPSTP